MSGESKKRGRAALEEIDLRLDGLLGTLGSALGEMVERLEQGEAGEVRRSHEVNTPRGPIRAETGVRVRFGLGGAADNSETAAPKPYTRRSQPEGTTAGPAAATATSGNATAAGAGTASGASPEATSAERPLAMDAYETDTHWVISADMPGVTLPELAIEITDDAVVVTSTGARRYTGRHQLPKTVDAADMTAVLRNGVLEISMGLLRNGGSA